MGGGVAEGGVESARPDYLEAGKCGYGLVEQLLLSG